MKSSNIMSSFFGTALITIGLWLGLQSFLTEPQCLLHESGLCDCNGIGLEGRDSSDGKEVSEGISKEIKNRLIDGF